VAKKPADAVEPVDEPVDVPDLDEPEPEDDEPAAAPGAGRQAVSSGAGWLLGLLAWAWIGLPFVKGGPTAVKNVWKAKFLNKAADGSELP
jgi:hypothetical protein